MDYRHIRVEPLTPTAGALIGGVELASERRDAVYDEIKQALWRHGVVFMRRQSLDHESFGRLGAVFGEMEQHEFFPHVPGYPCIQRVSNQGEDEPGTARWHTDVSFRARPNLVSILRLTDVPPTGGDTLWMHAGAAFDALGPAMQQMLASLQAEHDLPWHFRRVGAYDRRVRGEAEAAAREGLAAPRISAAGYEQRMIEQSPAVVHPVVITHPVTGRRVLYVNSIWTKRLVGLHMDLSEHLLQMLFAWLQRPEFAVRFRWEKDSLALWDNCAMQHYAVFDYAPHHRAGERLTCGSFAPDCVL